MNRWAIFVCPFRKDSTAAFISDIFSGGSGKLAASANPWLPKIPVFSVQGVNKSLWTTFLPVETT
jgi:hypothetical protein